VIQEVAAIVARPICDVRLQGLRLPGGREDGVGDLLDAPLVAGPDVVRLADSTALNTDREKDEDSDNDGHGKKATSPITFTGTDATGIADQAIAMMQAAFDTANTAAASTPKPKPSHSPEPSHSPRVPQSSHKPDGKGHD
jgi:hypothetical protein